MGQASRGHDPFPDRPADVFNGVRLRLCCMQKVNVCSRAAVGKLLRSSLCRLGIFGRRGLRHSPHQGGYVGPRRFRLASPICLAGFRPSSGFGRVEARRKRRYVADWTMPVPGLDVASFRVCCCGRVFWGRVALERWGCSVIMYQGCSSRRHYVGIHPGRDIYGRRNPSEFHRKREGTWKQAARCCSLGSQRTNFFLSKLCSLPRSRRGWRRGRAEPPEAPNQWCTYGAGDSERNKG